MPSPVHHGAGPTLMYRAGTPFGLHASARPGRRVVSCGGPKMAGTVQIEHLGFATD